MGSPVPGPDGVVRRQVSQTLVRTTAGGGGEIRSGGPHEGYRLEKDQYDGVDAQAFGVDPSPFSHGRPA